MGVKPKIQVFSDFSDIDQIKKESKDNEEDVSKLAEEFNVEDLLNMDP